MPTFRGFVFGRGLFGRLKVLFLVRWILFGTKFKITLGKFKILLSLYYWLQLHSILQLFKKFLTFLKRYLKKKVFSIQMEISCKRDSRVDFY